MISSTDLRRGIVIEVDGIIYSVVESQHIKPGKGSAFVRSKLRNIKLGTIITKTFNAGVKIPLIELTERKMQYLYNDNNKYMFMDNENYDQIEIDKVKLGDSVDLLKENIVVSVLSHNEEILGVELPTVVELKVIETPPDVRGDTASGGGKPAKLETGATVQVPFFIKEGDTVRVDTRTHEYVERA